LKKGRIRLAELTNAPEPEAPAPKAAAAAPSVRPTSAPHVSVYIHPIVIKEFKQLALNLDRRTHDFYLEGFDLVLHKYGRPSIAELMKKVER
jgi:hypothetical protein